MKYLKRTLIASLCALSAVAITSCNSSNSQKGDDSSLDDSTTLRVLKSDQSISQETRTSQIKAEYLLKNNGYKDSDEVSIIVSLSTNPLIDYYNDYYASAYATVSEFVESNAAAIKLSSIINEQTKAINELQANSLISGIKHRYRTVLNGFSTTTTYGKISEIENNPLVDKVILSDTYNLPQASTEDSSSSGAVQNIVDVYPTGIFNSSSVSYNGEGTVVAVLDSGFQCSHSVFKNQPEKEVINVDSISKVITELNAYESTKNLKPEDLYYSKKIPFMYDYADKDFDVNPYDSEHGTHVAGIIGGKDDVITGVATNTQLALMKVFGDTTSGAEAEDIVAALEDSVVLGVDCINVSLGTSCGFSREADNDSINAVYDAIEEAGISLIAAASNDYSSGFGGPNGNVNKVSNPDSGTVGSPSSYSNTLSVASISGLKSNYLVANNDYTFFFTESADVTAKKQEFVKDLCKADSELNTAGTKTYQYVTIPGVGIDASYNGIDVKGKIALVKRGSNTFDEKVKNAKKNGAVAVIIYNNVEGDISMSITDKDHIPAISVTKEVGLKLAEKKSGTITVSTTNLAGPFISDFSSWGPTPSLELKPEITAHGGEIKSAIPGDSYDSMSGTSMAAPNMCGVVVLIRQYLKEKYPNATSKEIMNMAYSLLMSTATIALNEEGNAYTPRKQGAGLANLKNAINTNGYISVDGNDKPKIELGDDAKRTGKYELAFTINNISEKAITYTLDLTALTETVSSSDEEYVAEKSYVLDNSFKATANGSAISNNEVTVPANGKVNVVISYELSDKDRSYIENGFPYGIYVEGFVKAIPTDSNETSLNAPFLAFYGDWTEAPLFDKTFFEVETEAHDGSIDDEDKIAADYYATRPYGSYMNNYIIPLGTYIYDIDESQYSAIPGSLDHIAISEDYGTIDGLSVVYAGCLRAAKTMTYTITDTVTGEVIYEMIDYNCSKAFGYNGSARPYYQYLRQKSSSLGLVNNRTYRFNMVGTIDYGDGGISTNVRNSFGFDFVMDNEAPIIKEAKYQKVYDKTLKKYRYYVTLTVYDNHYVQSITPISFNNDKTYTILTSDPIPVYSKKGADTDIKIEITDFLETRDHDAIVNNALSFNIDDYALNTNVFVVELPGTSESIWYTTDGNSTSAKMSIITGYVNEPLDLTQYLCSASNEDKSYFSYLNWTSSNESVAKVHNGVVMPYAKGRAVISCYDHRRGYYAQITVNVKDTKESTAYAIKKAYSGTENIKELTFDYFDTLYAHPKSYGVSDIAKTGAIVYTSSVPSPNMYPGESIKLHYNVSPWYVEDKYSFVWKSSNSLVASVDENGVVTALKEGSTNITLQAEGTSIIARIKITVLNEFIVENRVLVSYKGLGGDVVIPDDKGILYIGPYAFSLYESDDTNVNPDDDGDANKVPYGNTKITSVVVPEGCEQIQKYAFYNCPSLKSVTLPSTIRFIKEYAFAYDTKKYNSSALESINLEDVEVVGHNAFEGCDNLKEINLNNCYTIGAYGFAGCKSLTEVDLTKVRNAGEKTFYNCTNLTKIVTNESTKISAGMFENSGITSITLNATAIPDRAFYNCKNLTSITINGKLISIGTNAISKNENLKEIIINGSVEYINEKACENNANLEKIVLPNSSVNVSSYAFANNPKLSTVEFQEKTFFSTLEQSMFANSGVSTFVVNENNPNYTSENGMLVANNKILLVAPKAELGDYTLPSNITAIGDYAFSGVSGITSVTINNKVDLGIGVFASCPNLASVSLNEKQDISDKLFYNCSNLSTVNNLDKITLIGKYSFYNTGIKYLTISSNANVLYHAFEQSSVLSVVIGDNATIDEGVFKKCNSLVEVTVPTSFKEIKAETFYECINLLSFNFENIEKIGESSFYKTKIAEANMPNVLFIGESAFRNCNKLGVISIPKVKEIAAYAFSCDEAATAAALQAPIFTSVELPSSLTKLGVGTFMNCNKLTSVINNGTCDIAENAFRQCSELESVTLSNAIKVVGNYAFADCANLNSINLTNVEIVGEGAFGGTAKLTNVDLSNALSVSDFGFAASGLISSINAPKLTNIGSYAFQMTKISGFTAPKLESIGEGAFYKSTELTSFTISNDLKFIGDHAFLDATSLESINYNNNGVLSETGIVNNYVRLDNGILYTYVTEKKLNLHSVPAAKSFEKLEVLEGTYSIGFYAGNANKNVKAIVLPDSLRVIGAYAFFGYTGLNSVEFKSINAPTFECNYDSSLTLTEKDPGYEQLQNYFNVYGNILYYTNFVNLIGKNKPLNLIVPNNSKLNGYNSIIFEVYFGGIDNAQKSKYTAMDSYSVSYLEAMERIMNISVVALSDEALINTASTAYANMSTDLTKFGYTQDEINAMSDKLTAISKDLRDLKFKTASADVKKLQAKLDSLNPVFTIDRLSELNNLAIELSKLTISERAILDLTNYNALISSYNDYCSSLKPTIDAVNEVANNSFNYASSLVFSLLSLITVAGVALKSKF